MTVRELIERLQEYPLDLTVACVEDTDGEGVDPRRPIGILVTTNKDEKMLLLVPRGGRHHDLIHWRTPARITKSTE